MAQKQQVDFASLLRIETTTVLSNVDINGLIEFLKHLGDGQQQLAERQQQLQDANADLQARLQAAEASLSNAGTAAAAGIATPDLAELEARMQKLEQRGTAAAVATSPTVSASIDGGRVACARGRGVSH